MDKKRVLVVDDDPELLQLVRILLGRAGVDVVTAGDADAARVALSGISAPDLMILDVMLPDVSGVEFLRQMRDEAVFDEVPVLMLSALIDPDQIRVALDAGADRYLTKPYVANSLVSIVQELLRNGRRRVTT
ncbi:MAG: response regulator [Chloroflexota bacterium]|nr:response regulator [Chloroflexota bacterium]